MGGPPPRHGPRQALQLGLDATKASQNVLRLLESSHGVHNYSAHYQDTASPCWHDTCGKRWITDESRAWVARRPTVMASDHTSLDWIPTISWLQFSDDRTALAKLKAMDGSHRYISLLRLDSESMSSSLMVANDGWVIVQEVVSPIVSGDNWTTKDMLSLMHCLELYINIEHGGGENDSIIALDDLFEPQASLLSVGIAPSDRAPTAWDAPVGTLLEISLGTYVEGLRNQTPHSFASRYHDAIVQIDVTSGPNGTAAAAATVKVGNGTRTLVFVDHLLLGKEAGCDWKILSKTFSPQLWEDDGEDRHHDHNHDNHRYHDHNHDHKRK